MEGPRTRGPGMFNVTNWTATGFRFDISAQVPDRGYAVPPSPNGYAGTTPTNFKYGGTAACLP
jgi:hypothetical protein